MHLTKSLGERMVTLDVGCGNNPCGTVNIDIDRESSADVIASAEYLPFRNDTFNLVRSFHVLEHVNEPAKMMLEMLRVTQNCVHVIMPHRLSPGSKDKRHKGFFTQTWFKRFSNRYHVPCSIRFMFGFSRNLPIPIHIYLDVMLWT